MKKRYKQNHKKFFIVIIFALCIPLSMPSKAISMHAASCDRVVLVSIGSIKELGLLKLCQQYHATSIG